MWIVQGAWAWLVITTLVKWSNQGGVAAANHVLPGLLFVLVLHAGVWLYQKNRRPVTVQHRASEPSAPSIDDSIYDQVAAELSANQTHAGLMARAIAEANGDKDKMQAIYIKLRVAAIVAEQAKTEQKKTQPKDEIKDDFFQDAIRRGEQEKTADAKEAWANKVKAEHIAKYEKNKNQVYEKKLNRALIVIFCVMLFGATVYALVKPVESENSKAQQRSPALQKELDQLAKVHPDFDKIANDPAFHEWIKTQPADIQTLYESTSAQDNIVLLHMYKRVRSN